MTDTKVLVVEDENVIAMDLQRRLEGLGYVVTGTAGTADAAIRCAQSRMPDIVLMDIVLRGGTDGIELAETMREKFDLPVVYVTAHTDERTVARAKATGPYGYITKPVDDRQLQIAIEMAVFKHTSEKALRESEERFRQLAEASTEGIIVHDYGVVLDLNSRMARMLGYEPCDVIGKKFEKLVAAGRGRGPSEEPRPDDDGPVEILIRRKDGATFPAEMTGRSMPSRGRTVRVSAVRDITMRKQMEKLLREKARSELYGFVVSALPLIAPGALQTVREDMLRIFAERFEKYFRPRYEKEVKSPGGAGDMVDLKSYLAWAGELFGNFGISVATSVESDSGMLEFHSCPWLDYSKSNPVFCVLCQTMASRSFMWASPGGAVGVRGTIAGGGKSCRIELCPIRNDRKKQEKG